MMLHYELFYRMFGIRKAEQMLTPPLHTLDRFALPRRSILHCTTTNPLEGGPAVDDYVFNGILKPIQMAHITEVGDTKGSPRRMAISADALTRKYHTQHKRFRPLRDLEQAVRDDHTLVVYNYGFIPQLWRYTRSYYSDYYKWMNAEAAVWKNIAQLAQQTDRHQFVVCSLPQVLPSLPDLRLGTQSVNQKMVTIFSSPEALALLELWKWFGAERGSSVLSQLSDEHLARVNLVFTDAGYFFVVNLGLLNSWRKAGEEELKLNPKANTKGLAPDQMQRRFLRLMISLMHVRTVSQLEVDQVQDGDEQASDAPEVQGQVIKQAPSLPKADERGLVRTAAAQTVTDAQVSAQNALKVDTAEDVVAAQTAELEKKIDSDLAELETISQQVVAKKLDEPQAPEIVEEQTLEQGVMAVCDRLAEAGLISAAEYKRYNTLAASYRSLTDPETGETLDKFIQVSKEQLTIPESPAVPDIPTVVDKTMLKSSLMVFDERYIKTVMKRDVAAMVLNLQKAGIAVTNYEVERVNDVLGSYYDYTARVAPVEGAPSTFRFKLPAIEDDGTYQANGVKYRMRKQRGDKRAYSVI